MIVVSDTTPLNYLILIERVDILRTLYESIIIPPAVLTEMQADGTPAPVVNWTRDLPDWIIVQHVESTLGSTEIQQGEAEAIALAEHLNADLILLDDKLARELAQRRGLRVIGTLGVMVAASKRGLIDLNAALADLSVTNFRFSKSVLQVALEQAREP